jgi:ABC-2 type transport system ATP-binding protein
LDPQTRRVVWDFVHRLQKEWNLTILATTHYLEEAENEMDKVAIIDKGHIMALGTPSELTSNFGRDLVELSIKPSNGSFTQDQLKSKLDSLQLGDELSVRGCEVRIHVENGKKTLPSIMHKMESVGFEIDSISVRTPSLDDVFIKYTGRGIREEEDADGAKRDAARLIGRMRRRI